jgi:cytoskeletal protein RodZ
MPDTLGQRLKFARQERRLSIEQAAEGTRIRPHYLQALEADDYSAMPSPVQARGFLRNYADFLGLDLQSILEELQAARPVEPVSGPLPQVDLAPPAPEAPARPAVEEEPARTPAWRAWLGRLRKPAPTPEPDPVLQPLLDGEPAPAQEASPPEPQPVPDLPPAEEALPPIELPQPEPVSMVEEPAPAPQPRVRKKKVEPAPVEPPARKPRAVKAKTGAPAVKELPTRTRRAKKAEETPTVQEPTTRARRKKVEPDPEPQTLAPEAPETPVQPPAEAEREQAAAEAETLAEGVEPAQVQVEGEGRRPSLWARAGASFASWLARLRQKPVPPAESPVAPEAEEVEPPAAVPEPEPAAEPDGPGETPAQIFAEIGRALRVRRELLSLTLEEIERHTHVRVVFARALEEGNFDQLPSPVQARGMLTTYSAFLDLDVDVLLLRFADALQAGHRARYPVKANGERKPDVVRSTLPSLSTFMAGDMLYGLVVVLMAMILVGWGLGHIFARQAEQVALPTAPSIADVLVGTPLPTIVQEVTLIPAADTPFALAETATPEATLEILTPNLNIKVALNIIAAERTFMRVLVDGQEVFNGRVLPGNAYPFEAAESVQVLTGNGAALRVTYNGRDMGLLGTFGEVVNYIYTVDSIITPTPPAPPTATSTPNVTPTPSPTPSPTPTSTATPQD